MNPTPHPRPQDPPNPARANPKLTIPKINELQLSTHKNSKQGQASVNVNVNLSEENTINSDTQPQALDGNIFVEQAFASFSE